MQTWKPIVNNDLKEEADSLITGIADRLIKNTVNDYSLVSGDTGIGVFFAYLSIIKKEEKYSNIAVCYIEKIIKSLNEEVTDASFMYGFTGMAWFIRHMESLELISSGKEVERFYESIDNAIANAIEMEAKKGNADLFDGLVGMGIYLLERSTNKKAGTLLERIVQHIESLAIIDEDGASWIDSSMRFSDTKEYNLGLAHGIPSVMVLLSKIYAKGILQEKISTLLPKVIDWLWKQQLKDSVFTFPCSSTSSKSLLGWCYGDLGVAIALYQVGNNLLNMEWIDRAQLLAKKTIAIGLKNPLMINNAYLCHGASGLVNIYNRFFQSGKEIVFKEAALYWLKILINRERKEYEEQGNLYEIIKKKENLESQENIGLLNGMAGIGLSLLAVTSNIEPRWDTALLMS